MAMVNVAILDDYQKVALSSADWSPVGGRADVTVFTDHIADETALIRRLAPFDVIVAMRERPAFPAAALERLGLGRIGQRIVHYAHAFDMNCIAWSQNLTGERAEAAGARLVTREQLDRKSVV